MDNRPRDELEAEVRRRFDLGDLEGAATAAMQGYGPEIYSFLAAFHRSQDDADEVFSRFAEGLWHSLPHFAWQSSFRTWAYAIARRASLNYRRAAHHRNQRNVPLPEGSTLPGAVAQVRSQTLPHLRTEIKSRIAELRATLAPEDQELLVLRVDRKLAWTDLAQVLRGEDEPPLAGDALKREAARLRKRFQLVKDNLREMARREGLLGPDASGDDP
jgi:RNA polymerase sigma-70 factor (ECF subfamily)